MKRLRKHIFELSLDAHESNSMLQLSYKPRFTSEVLFNVSNVN
jgi:hypothetical protein